MNETRGKMNDEVMDRYLQAGQAAKSILKQGADKIAPGVGYLEIAEFVEGAILDKGLGIAFPVNISVNEVAAHDTPSIGDERIFNAGDMVKLDIGAHLDGYIADTACTVDLGDCRPLVEASVAGRDAAIKNVKPGVTIGELGTLVAHEIESRGFHPISNLTGHGLDQYKLHMGPNVPNIAMNGGAVLEEGMVIAIEPFASTGHGLVSDRSRIEIYSQMSWRPVRLPSARKILAEIDERRGMPFAKRHIKTQKPDLAMSRLIADQILYGYHVLADISGSKVSQAEHTMIVTADGCIVTTR